ncbi:MAG: DUF2235 domain-containing protein, partial [Acidimicrobiia bacterium]|nr:DUF2235 domain-containing protein [Acidimicrobiia bacterium]
MRNLVLCLDGTWNRADALHPTNVVLTMRAAARCALSGRPPRSVFHRGQVIYYDAGVGTGRWDRVRGGAFGMGLGDNVKQAYRWLCQNWRPNDRIFVFGYSRGAYTARSLAGLIGRCGIQEPRNAQAAIDAHCGNDTEAAVRLSNEARTIYVDFLGVWDTVGSLGVPIDGLRWMGAWRHRWHDVSIGEHVRRACHLVAIDEARGPFQPALWTGPVAPNQVVEQVWFPGVHGDVGGGRPDPNLS